MANYLIPYVEFLGLPGCGKSYYSHKVAEKLRGEGYKIAEPSWELDHTNGKYTRVIKKMMMAWLFTLCHHREAKGIKEVIRSCRLSKTEGKRFHRNIFYKAYLLKKKTEKVLFFDEGLAQMAVSLSVSTDKTARRIYDELLSVLSLKKDVYLIKIDCSAEMALLNMDKRSSHDSHVEQLFGLDAKKEYLNRYKTECESINNVIAIPFSYDSEKVVEEIMKIIKSKI